MPDREQSTAGPTGNAFRGTFLAFVERPEPHAVCRAFGELLDDLVKEGSLVLQVPGESDPGYARRHLAAAASDLRHVVESLRSLAEFRDEIEDARAAVAAHDALPELERAAARLEGTITGAA